MATRNTGSSDDLSGAYRQTFQQQTHDNSGVHRQNLQARNDERQHTSGVHRQSGQGHRGLPGQLPLGGYRQAEQHQDEDVGVTDNDISENDSPGALQQAQNGRPPRRVGRAPQRPNRRHGRCIRCNGEGHVWGRCDNRCQFCGLYSHVGEPCKQRPGVFERQGGLRLQRLQANHRDRNHQGMNQGGRGQNQGFNHGHTGHTQGFSNQGFNPMGTGQSPYGYGGNLGLPQILNPGPTGSFMNGPSSWAFQPPTHPQFPAYVSPQPQILAYVSPQQPLQQAYQSPPGPPQPAHQPAQEPRPEHDRIARLEQALLEEKEKYNDLENRHNQLVAVIRRYRNRYGLLDANEAQAEQPGRALGGGVPSPMGPPTERHLTATTTTSAGAKTSPVVARTS